MLKAASLIKSHEALLILGSGPLHEIPLEELAKKFKRIDLVDVVHLNETKRQYAHLKNILFIEADVTQLESKIQKEKKIINQLPTLLLDTHYDLVISANLLSQLPYHLRSFLEKKAIAKYDEKALDDFCYQVSLDHYHYLLNFKCPVVLITDTETHCVGLQDEILEIQKPFINFTLPPHSDLWWWNVAPRPEFSKDFSLKMKVSAFILNFDSNPPLI